uniref:hypothetical protein n=1 Tax=Amycolatopsis sp. CA-096443 TaxID=3239919 RepID=UPI003F497F63
MPSAQSPDESTPTDPTGLGRALADWRKLRTPDDAERARTYTQLLQLTRTTARKLGAEDGKSGAAWVFDGNTDPTRYARCLALDEDGDPAWDSEFGVPAPGPLSGGHADVRTANSLLADLGVAEILDDEDSRGEARETIVTAYQEAFAGAWSEEVLRTARYHANAG